MTTRRTALLTALASLPAAGLAGCAGFGPRASRDDTAAQARAAELSFARTMADRDLAAFGAHVSDNAVFLNGGKPLRGHAAIIEGWRRFFEKPAPPFSWSPDVVEVIRPGELAYTEGPVVTTAGVNFARFYTLWQFEADGRWRVALDNGYEVCGANR